jgi:hypothetical protein
MGIIINFRNMQRRKFIGITVAGGAVIGLTGLYCNTKRPAFYAVLDKPGQLAHICDAKTILEIGKAYRVQTPSESGSERLINLLSSDSTGEPLPTKAENVYVEEMISKKIKQDFEEGNTVVVKGWILAVTEARQCALFALNNQ